jgi:para-nitrobenzyl esterase
MGGKEPDSTVNGPATEPQTESEGPAGLMPPERRRRWRWILGGTFVFSSLCCGLPLMLISLYLPGAPAEEKGAPDVVKVTGGRVEGVSREDGVRVFKGIPFAEPPVGELRWKPPQPVKPWDGVRQAKNFGPSPMQDGIISVLMGVAGKRSEDCLHLNVWTPAKKADEKLPVMVWIFGGAFSMGSASIPLFDGTHLAEKGVVLVSVNYRVGPFGFLAHPELSREQGGGSGNYGILDQIAGLRWVRDNIAAFGGDPDCVTIFGESAGGISTGILASSPRAKGLFHRVISESGGSSFAPPKRGGEGGLYLPTLEAAEREGQKLLASVKAADIAAARALPADAIQKGEGWMWPNIGGEVLPDDSAMLYREGKFNDTPILIGTNSNEGSVSFKSESPESFPRMVREGYGEPSGAILSAYPHATKAEAARAGKDLTGDAIFAAPTLRWAELQAEKGQGKAFLYYFDHPRGEAGHGSEIAYVFRALGGRGLLSVADTTENRKVSDLVSGYWVNFARTGDPNGEGLPEWSPFTAGDAKAMVLDASPSMEPVPHRERLEVLDAYFTWRREQAGKTPPK